MIRFNVSKPRLPGITSITAAKTQFLYTVGGLLLMELFVATSTKGTDSLGMKSGLLRKSLRMDVMGNQVIVYFDPRVAPYAQFAVAGTKYIKSRGLLEKTLDRVQGSEGYIQARQKLLTAIGL